MPLGREEYHLQHRMFLSMTDTVEYIRRHDQGLAKEKEEAKSLNRMLQDARRSYIQKIREPAKAACGK